MASDIVHAKNDLSEVVDNSEYQDELEEFAKLRYTEEDEEFMAIMNKPPSNPPIQPGFHDRGHGNYKDRGGYNRHSYNGHQRRDFNRDRDRNYGNYQERNADRDRSNYRERHSNREHYYERNDEQTGVGSSRR